MYDSDFFFVPNPINRYDLAQRDKTLAGLRQAAGFIRRLLGRRIRLRHTPDLAFHYDEGLDATERVARLLEQTRGPDGEEPEGGEEE